VKQFFSFPAFLGAWHQFSSHWMSALISRWRMHWDRNGTRESNLMTTHSPLAAVWEKQDLPYVVDLLSCHTISSSEPSSAFEIVHFLKTFCIIAGSNSYHASIIQLQIVKMKKIHHYLCFRTCIAYSGKTVTMMNSVDFKMTFLLLCSAV
jgi:hypothetical protein